MALAARRPSDPSSLDPPGRVLACRGKEWSQLLRAARTSEHVDGGFAAESLTRRREPERRGPLVRGRQQDAQDCGEPGSALPSGVNCHAG